MLERTSYKVYPIIEQICSKLVKDKVPIDIEDNNDDENDNNDAAAAAARDDERSFDSVSSLDNMTVDMKALLGYLNQNEWLYLLNIGNIMQVTALTI